MDKETNKYYRNLMPYGTTCEMNYIDTIGKDVRPCGMTRLERLTNYHKASQKRVRWDIINREIIMRHVLKAIMEEEQKIIRQ